MESENSNVENNNVSETVIVENTVENTVAPSTSFSLNNSYVEMKTKINSFIENNLSPLVGGLKNSGYGKLLIAFMTILSVVFGYITMNLLQNLYFVACSVNSVRALKNNEDLKPIVNNWVTYSAIMLIFYVIDLLSYITGDVIKIVFDICKFVVLFCLYGSIQTQENLNYWMSRIYSCNNRVIDTTQNGINTFLGYVYQSCNKENFEEIMQSVSKLTSKDKTN